LTNSNPCSYTGLLRRCDCCCPLLSRPYRPSSPGASKYRRQYRASKGVWTPLMYTFLQMQSDINCSTRRSLPLYPQCVSVRRWCLPSSAPPTTAILAAPEPLVSSFRDESSLHIGGPAERLRARSNCGDRPGFRNASVQVFEERPAMEQLGRCCRVRCHVPSDLC
jgi:hypothetical protein